MFIRCETLAKRPRLKRRGRRWEFCEADIDVLAEFAGIDKRSVVVALSSLEENFLIERHDECLNYLSNNTCELRQ